MNRREFLIKSASFLAGTLGGVHALPRAFAASTEPWIAIIIDDIGHSLSKARRFLDLSIPMTFAILPRLAHSEHLAYEIHGQGHPIMLHQPMEPLCRGLDPGPGALFVGDASGKIIRVMKENLAAVPYAIGVNNHMGSRFTASCREVHLALDVLMDTGLFFVDSLTTSRSVAYETARRLHVPAAFRHVFLDNQPCEGLVLANLKRLRSYALRHGSAIGIGHPYPETAQAIGRFARAMKDSEVSLVQVSDLIPRNQ